MSRNLFRSLAFVLATAVVSLTLVSEAYIPSSRTIAVRTAKNNGKGAYAIEQDVQFRAGADSVTLRERWVVLDGETMRLSVTTPGSTGANSSPVYEAAYRSGKKTAPDSSGSLKTTPAPTEFIERFTHARSSNELLQAFVRAGIVPQSFLQERQRFNPNSKNPNAPEANVRLGRSNGVITWIFGVPSPADGSKALPGAWIEQDAFSIRRLRFPSEAELSADQYALQNDNFMFPRERTVTWSGNTAVIRMVSVKPIASPTATAALALNSPAAPRLPEQTHVKEFYSRFR